MKRGPSRVIDLSEFAGPGVRGRRLLWIAPLIAAALLVTYLCSDLFRSAPRLRRHVAATPDRELPFLGGVLKVPSSGWATVETHGDTISFRFPGRFGEGHVVLRPLPDGVLAERACAEYFGCPDQRARYPRTATILRRRRSLAGMGDLPAHELVLAEPRGGQLSHHFLFLDVEGRGVQVEYTTLRTGSTGQVDQIEALLAGMTFRPAGS